MKTLVLIPDLRRKGGVANYYRCLMLNNEKDIDYLQINSVSTTSESKFTLFDLLIIVKKMCFLPFVYYKFILQAFKYDLIHINPSLNRRSFFRDMVFILLSRIMRIKVLVFFRGWDDEYEISIKKNKLLSYLFRLTYAKSNCFIVLGDIFKQKLIGLGVDSKKKFYVETTIADSSDINHLNLKNKIESFNKEINFLFISRIIKSKGIYIAIDSFIKCNEKIGDRMLNLYIAGDGEELLNVKNYVKIKKYSNIIFTGYAKDELKKELLLKCHIMIFPSYYGEGLPNCILEGMLYGMPIISRINGGIPDVVTSNVNGYLGNSLNYEEYATYCIDLINNKDAYSTIARENNLKASNYFTTEAVKKKLLNIYKSS